MNFWNLGINGTNVHGYSTNSVTGHLDMVPYPPDFLMDSQLKGAFSWGLILKGEAF